MVKRHVIKLGEKEINATKTMFTANFLVQSFDMYQFIGLYKSLKGKISMRIWLKLFGRLQGGAECGKERLTLNFFFFFFFQSPG